MDFKGDSENSRLRINDFVENATSGHIKDLFPSGTIDSDTTLVLANAVFFKGAWTTKFEAADTLTKPFHGTTTANVRMMSQTETFKYR